MPMAQENETGLYSTPTDLRVVFHFRECWRKSRDYLGESRDRT